MSKGTGPALTGWALLRRKSTPAFLRSAVYNLAQLGKIPVRNGGRHRCCNRDTLVDWIARQNWPQEKSCVLPTRHGTKHSLASPVHIDNSVRSSLSWKTYNLFASNRKLAVETSRRFVGRIRQPKPWVGDRIFLKRDPATFGRLAICSFPTFSFIK